ncbi:hypothetical protein HAX54_037337 [Datura stramonium]|uniref:Uncharacterized protein n=1 Tax=Datura stramonium TaxID=4076 RepID=A0ABS8RMJ0_DATST|nr:hypothetical protein [Datura stramonium]
MAHLEQELEILREELCQEDFPKSTHPPQISLANLAYLQSLLVILPNAVKQTPYVPNYTNVPPYSPPEVRNAPNLSLPTQDGTMYSYQAMQRIPDPPVKTSCDPYVPPVYTFEAPTFTTPIAVKVLYEVLNMNK